MSEHFLRSNKAFEISTNLGGEPLSSCCWHDRPSPGPGQSGHHLPHWPVVLRQNVTLLACPSLPSHVELLPSYASCQSIHPHSQPPHSPTFKSALSSSSYFHILLFPSPPILSFSLGLWWIISLLVTWPFWGTKVELLQVKSLVFVKQY